MNATNKDQLTGFRYWEVLRFGKTARNWPLGKTVRTVSKRVMRRHSREVAIYSGGSIPIRSFTASRIFCLHPR